MPSVVQSVTGKASNTTGILDLTLPSPTTAGNTVVVFLGASAGLTVPAAVSCTLGGSAGNFTVAASVVFSSDTALLAVWEDPDCAAGQTAIAVSSGGPSGGTYSEGIAYEISGLTASPADRAVSASGSGTSWSATTAATTQASEIWLGAGVSLDSTTITGPASPWANTAGLVYSPDPPMAMLAGWKTVSATGTATYAGTANIYGSTPDWAAVAVTLKGTSGASGTGSAALPARRLSGTGIAGITGTGSVRLPARRLAATAAEAFAGTGSLRMPARSLAGGSYSDFTGTGGVTMPARSLSVHAIEQFTASGGVRLPPTAGRVTAVALVNPGMVLRPAVIAGSGYVSPVGGGGVAMPAPSLAGSGAQRILATGSVTLPARSLAGTALEMLPGAGAPAMPARRLSAAGTVITTASGGVTLPARSLSASGTETITGTGGVRLPGFTLSGLVGEQPQGSGGVVMAKMALSGRGILPVREVWRTPDRVHKSGAVMS